MSHVLAIDPGNTQSAWVIIDADTCEPIRFAKEPNEALHRHILTCPDEFQGVEHVVIEMIASYGMAVGREVFDTCVWIGRFDEAIRGHWYPPFSRPELVFRRDVKLHHCGTSKAKDPNVTRALVDRFAPGSSNFGKGTKAIPGWFYGFSKDVWQAYALAVLVADRLTRREGVA